MSLTSPAGRRRRPAAIALALGITTALALAPVATAQDEVQLDYWYQSSGPEGLAVHEAAARAYEEANPGVRVTVTPYSFDDMQRILPVTLDGGTGPDVGSISWGAQATDLFASAGHLMDITDHAREQGWLDSYSADLLEFANRAEPGRIFGIPPEQATVGVYYNSEIFDELGLTVPTTFEEFEAILAALKEAGITPIATGGGDAWPLAHVWEQLIHTMVPFEHLTALEVELDPEARYDIPEMVAAAAKVLEWHEKGYFNQGMLGTGYLDANNLFITGQAALNIGGTWAAPEFATQPDFEARFFPMPQVDPSLDWHAGGKAPSDVLVVTAYAEDPEASLAFLGHMLSEETARRLWDAGKFVTFAFDEVPPPANPLQADIYDAMQRTGPGYYMGVNCVEVNRGNWSALQGMIAGDTTPEETMAAVQAIYESECGKYRE
jgi:raffinose/stachyose/melibiose transport system substrate-binding protein